jgi:hypothetical protein
MPAMTKPLARWILPLAAVTALGGSALAFNVSRAHAAAKATPTATQAESDPAFGHFLGACTTNADCADGNICSSFKKRGPHCTHTCESAQDCAAPSTRCTKLSRCGLVEPIKTEP